MKPLLLAVINIILNVKLRPGIVICASINPMKHIILYFSLLIPVLQPTR